MNASGFIDDVCNLNDFVEFSKSFHVICCWWYSRIVLMVFMPDLSCNISAYAFYRSILSEFLRIVKCSFKFSDFVPKDKFCL